MIVNEFSVGDIVQKVKEGILDEVQVGDICEVVIKIDHPSSGLFDILVKRLSDGATDWQQHKQFVFAQQGNPMIDNLLDEFS